MTPDQRYIISVLRKSMGISDDDLTPCDSKSVEQIVLCNDILLTVYRALDSEIKSSLKDGYLATIVQSVNQNYEGNRVIDALSQAGFDCIALKGWVMRDYYPHPNMRQMVDLDILVRPYDYERIREIMENTPGS